MAPRFSRASHKLADFLISKELETVVKKIEFTKAPTVMESTIQQSINDSFDDLSLQASMDQNIDTRKCLSPQPGRGSVACKGSK